MGFVIEAGFFFCTVRRNDFASRSSFNFLAEQGPRNVHGKANAARQDVIRDALPPTPIPPANRPTNPLRRRETELAAKYRLPSFDLEFTGGGIRVRILNRSRTS